ncbi:hypothetical protein BH10ACT3_BH10ACT3_16130 [soil metagenome]
MAEGRDTTTKVLIVVIVLAAVLLVGLVVVALVRRDGPGPVDPSPAPSSTASTLSPTTSPSGASTTSTTPASRVDRVDHTIQMGLLARTYTTVSPQDIRPDERLPVVMALHGLGADSNVMLDSADWGGAIVNDRFIAVFPQGVANSWNMGPCCPPANLLGIDDMAFLDQVVAQVTASPQVNAERLYLTGFSNGGIMAYAVVCARPGVYAALAPMSGSNVGGCAPSQPISLLHQHADPDPVVPFDGSLSLTQLLSAADFPPVPQSVAAWAAADGCPTTPTTSTGDGGIETTQWSPCGNDTRVELVRLPGVGHNWLDLGDYRALDTMLDFFGLQ